MKYPYSLSQQFIACILVMSLCLQSCGNPFNSPLPNSMKERKTKQLVHQVDISPILDQEFRAEGGHLVTLYEYKGALKASVEIIDEKDKVYNDISVTIEEGADLASLPHLSKTIQQSRIQVQLGTSGNPTEVILHQPWLIGGMLAGNEEISSEVLSESLWEQILPYLSNKELYAINQANQFYYRLSTDILHERKNNLNTEWLKEYHEFVGRHHLDSLRQDRSIIDRPIPSFSLAVEILEFIEEVKKKYGADILLESDYFFELLIDVCDIVNAQDPDFKEQYDVFVEQHLNDKTESQLPFSLYNFDQIAQVFYHRKELFNNNPGSAYMLIIKEILNHELPILMDTFKLIDSLNNMRDENDENDKSNSYQGAIGELHLMSLNRSLEQMLDKSCMEKKKVKKEIKGMIDAIIQTKQPRLKRLYTITSMTHDYLTLGRIMEILKLILTIEKFTTKEEIKEDECKLKEGREKIETLKSKKEKAEKDILQLKSQLDSINQKENNKTKKENNKTKKVNQKASTLKKIKNLTALVQNMEEKVNIAKTECRKYEAKIDKFRKPREAFLAAMIQIGELATNKNISQFVRDYMPTIPWENLVYLRNAIEHQDEWGTTGYFTELIDGTNTSIDFEQWKKGLKILNTSIVDAKKRIWGDDPKAVFEIWLEAELRGEPIYGVHQITLPTPIPENKALEDKKMVSKFRKTPLYKCDKLELWKNDKPETGLNDSKQQKEGDKQAEQKKWGSVLNQGEKHITLKHFEYLKKAEEDAAKEESQARDDKAKEKAQDLKKTYNYIKNYLLDRLKQKAIHLKEEEKKVFVELAEKHINNPSILTMCLAFLKKDQSYLKVENVYEVINACIKAKLEFKSTIQPIYSRLRLDMPITRQVCQEIHSYQPKPFDQPERKKFADKMFTRTTEHLHNLTHSDGFCKLLFGQLETNICEYNHQKNLKSDDSTIRQLAQEYEDLRKRLFEKHGYVNEYGLKYLHTHHPEVIEEEIKHKNAIYNYCKKSIHKEDIAGLVDYQKEVINKLYSLQHKLYLQNALDSAPVNYLASVYSMSIGLGALKSWVKQEPSPSSKEKETVKKLRYGRNFIAHGDLFRNMNNIDLRHIQQYLLGNHLEHCVNLNFACQDILGYANN